MTNTVDVLVIDGSLASMMFNTPRPVPDTFTFPQSSGDELIYKHVVHHNENDDKYYHIAIDDEATPQEYIDSFIAIYHFTPGWDINEPEGA